MKKLGTTLRKTSTGVLASLMLGGTLTVGAAVVAAPAANAVGIDSMDLVCQYTYRNTSWRAWLSYPSQGAYGWRCDNRATPQNELAGADIYGFCVNVLGGSYTTNVPSNPYSWQCY